MYGTLNTWIGNVGFRWVQHECLSDLLELVRLYCRRVFSASSIFLACLPSAYVRQRHQTLGRLSNSKAFRTPNITGIIQKSPSKKIFDCIKVIFDRSIKIQYIWSSKTPKAGRFSKSAKLIYESRCHATFWGQFQCLTSGTFLQAGIWTSKHAGLHIYAVNNLACLVQ